MLSVCKHLRTNGYLDRYRNRLATYSIKINCPFMVQCMHFLLSHFFSHGSDHNCLPYFNPAENQPCVKLKCYWQLKLTTCTTLVIQLEECVVPHTNTTDRLMQDGKSCMKTRKLFLHNYSVCMHAYVCACVRVCVCVCACVRERVCERVYVHPHMRLYVEHLII